MKIIKGENEMLEDLYRFKCEVEGVTLVCFLEHEPEELNYGDAPDVPECMNLLSASCGDIDIVINRLAKSTAQHI